MVEGEIKLTGKCSWCAVNENPNPLEYKDVPGTIRYPVDVKEGDNGNITVKVGSLSGEHEAVVDKNGKWSFEVPCEFCTAVFLKENPQSKGTSFLIRGKVQKPKKAPKTGETS